ncbi:hypothetical protein WN71_002545 [Streptomyces mangrovisoli]|uniref:Uncharacterized protein n=1 Tax=Streptomyces mangrovisoli TaxID=1428628 RepID=A0A1J4P410_9ACTN|nr:hypothetical protein WN71_002545 [Streptomyces mangrovisoli]
MPGPTSSGALLYARSRALPHALAAAGVTAVLAAGAARLPGVRAEPDRVLFVVVLWALGAASVIGASLHAECAELDGTAARRWWRWRLAHLLGLTGSAACAAAVALPTPALAVVLALACTGVTAAAAALLGARVCWLPAVVVAGVAGVASGGDAGALRAWPAGPGGWSVALALFAAGGALHVVRGARPEGPRGG